MKMEEQKDITVNCNLLVVFTITYHIKSIKYLPCFVAFGLELGNGFTSLEKESFIEKKKKNPSNGIYVALEKTFV